MRSLTSYANWIGEQSLNGDLDADMDADFSIELGGDDPVLDFPWKDPNGRVSYVDVKRHPDLLTQIDEAERFRELKELLRTLNSPRSRVETAKCDAWMTQELNVEEEIYEASHKFSSYVDIVFSRTENERSSQRLLFSAHHRFADKLVKLLRLAPNTSTAAEICVRRCYFEEADGIQDGFYFTLYVSGYGCDESSARQKWGVGLRLLGNAILQLSAGDEFANDRD
jgi:hypothetical protein